jgi:16S rRNA (guanine527-N7)-methyltransferase
VTDAPVGPAGAGGDQSDDVAPDDRAPVFPVMPPEWPAVLAALDEARARGFVGGGQDLDALAEHARGFVAPIAGATRVLDLGSGGGVPGLVIAALRPDATVTLLDASVGRTDWLRRVVGRLGWGDRVQVVTGRAELLAHNDAWRESQDAVVARSFAPTLVTAEVGSALLHVGGRLVVSEPPTHDPTRWPAAVLAQLGFRQQPWPDPRYAVLEAIASPGAAIPRPRVVRGHTS